MLHVTARADLLEATRAWLVDQGLRDRPPDRLIDGFARRLLVMGVPLARLFVTLKTIHPTFGGIAHRWHRDGHLEREAFDRGAIPRWHDSPLYYMLTHHARELRVAPPMPGEPDALPILQQLWAAGITDYYATRFLFGDPLSAPPVDPENPPEGAFVTLSTDAPDGFTEDDIADFRLLLPVLAVALKSGANRQMAHDLLATYLGPDPGARVMSGAIGRGSTDRIDAVILCFDLNGFTRLSQEIDGDSLIAMLNTYFSLAVAEIEARGGTVLKFMGDGLLAVFTGSEAEAARAALETVRAIRAGLTGINATRRAEDLPATDCAMALHAGRVLYGNIGAPDRLDFTVIGTAVNTAARLLELCARLGRRVLLSDRVAELLRGEALELASLGRHSLRGVATRHELFTLD